MKNNMYDILGKLKGLMPTPKVEAKPATPIYESVEARGSIVAGVKGVEQKLREQFDALKEGEVTKTATGIVHRANREKSGREPEADYVNKARTAELDKGMGVHWDKSPGRGRYGIVEPTVDEARETLKTAKGKIYKGGTYGTEYDGDDAPKKEKHVPKTGQRGRPTKEREPEYKAPNGDVFGRTTGVIPKGQPGRLVKGKASEGLGEERETLKTAKGKIYKGGTYGTEYDGDDAPKKVKHVPKTGQKGRPKKEQPAASTAPKGDIFGRTTGAIPKGKGRVVKGKATGGNDDLEETMNNPYAIGMAQAKKEVGLGKARKTNLPKKTINRGHHIAKVIQTNEGVKRRVLQRLSEGVNFSELVKEKDRTLTELLNELQQDIKTFKDTGHCSDFLRDCMEVHGYGKKQLQDAINVPRGNSFAPQHPATPAPKPGFLDRAKAVGHNVLNTLGHGSDEELLAKLPGKAPNRYNESDELNELAKLAGLTVSEANDGNLANNAKPYDKVTRGDVVAGRLGKDEQGGKKTVDEADMEEGNEFSGELAKAKAQHQDSFEVGGKKYTVKESQLDECGEMSPMGDMAQEMNQGRINVSTNASSDGNKSVTINADGEAAEQLMSMLRMAGLGGGQAHAQQAEIVIAQEAKAYGDATVETPPEYVNSPREDVRGMHRAETTGMANTSDDLHKQKGQHPKTAAKGDNPLTKKETKLEDFNPIDTLGRKLMAEYESIKVQK